MPQGRYAREHCDPAVPLLAGRCRGAMIALCDMAGLRPAPGRLAHVMVRR